MVVILIGTVFVGIAPMLLVAATIGHIPVLAIGFLLAVFAGLGVVLAIISPRYGLYLLTTAFAFQSIVLVPLSRYLDSESIKLLLGAKELLTTVLLCMLAARFRRRFRLTVADGGALAFLAIYAFYLLLPGSSNTFAKLVSFREPFMIVALYALGRLFGTLGAAEIQRYLRFLVVLSLVVASFGYVERFLFSPETWNALGATSFITTKLENARFGIPFYEGLPATWWTYIGGGIHRRMVATIVDAPSLSRFFALPVLFLISRLFHRIPRVSALPGTLAIPALAILGGALLLTVGRGGIAIVGIGIALLLVRQRRIFAASLMVLVVTISLASVLNLNQANIDRHVAGLNSGFSALGANPLGQGLGTSGQLAAAYAGENIRRVVEESYVGSLIAQLGIPGALGYFGFFGLLFGSLLRALRAHKKDSARSLLDLLALTGVIGILATSFLASSAVSPISAGPFLIIIGSTVTLARAYAGGATRVPVHASAPARG